MNWVTGVDSGAPQRSETLLLIGSTGNGKSTLGNFLIDPTDAHIFSDEGQAFRTARDSNPETQSSNVVQVDTMEGKPLIRVIDTPGLNENATKDLQHMIDIVKTLNGIDSVSACILCVKFESKIDAQYIATVAYYRKLLPRLFEAGNLVIVLTAFQTDARSEMERKRRRVDVDAVVANAQKVVRTICDLSYNPQVLLIDSMPMTDKERRESEENRRAILTFVRSTMKPLRVCDLMVAKTDELKKRDAEHINLVDGEIRGYNTRLKEANSTAKVILSTIELQEKQISQVDRDINNLKAELKEKESSDLVVAEEWSLNQEWKLFEWQTASFKVRSSWPVLEYSTWDNGRLTWSELNVTQYGATGKVSGKFCRGLYANLTLKTSSELKFQVEIRELKEDKIPEQCQCREKLKENLDGLYAEHKGKIEEILLLQQYVRERNKTKEHLSRDPIPVQEALSRLQKLMSS